MPKLNRARLAGIVYGSQSNPYKIDDLTYEYMGYNTIKILENGGGKTATIQLLTQPILPNQRIGERYFKDTIKYSDRGHIVLEWRDEQRYIYTGFFFSVNRSSQQVIDTYHMYVFESQTSILHDLPLVKEGRSASWSAIRKHIGNLDPAIYRTEWFDRSTESKEKHRKKLRQYNILQEEWERIVSINGDEGDAEAYFKKADTDQKLIEKILVPQVEQAMYKTEEKRDQLTTNFMRYRERIANIPRIRKSIENLELFKDKSERILKQAEEAEEKRSKAKRDVRSYEQGRVSLGVIYREKEDLVRDYEERITEERGKATELDWKFKSHDLFLSKGTMDRLREDIASAQERILEKEKEKEDTLSRRNRATAFYYDAGVQETEQTIREYQEKIELLDQQEPELQKEYAESKRVLKTAWEEQDRTNRHQEKEIHDKIQQFDEAEKEAEEAKENAQDELRSMKERQKNVNIFFEERMKLYQEALRVTEEMIIDQPAVLLEKIREQIVKTEQDLEETKKRFNNQKDSYYNNREKVNQAHNKEENEAREAFNAEQKRIEEEADQQLSEAFLGYQEELDRLKKETNRLIGEAATERDTALEEMERKSQEIVEERKEIRDKEMERAQTQLNDGLKRLEEDVQFRTDQHTTNIRDAKERHRNDTDALAESQKEHQRHSIFLGEQKEEKKKFEETYACEDLYEGGHTLIEEAEWMAEKASKEQQRLSRELYPKEKTVRTIEQEGHLPAHEELVMVQEHLKQKGFQVTLGMERLRTMDHPEEANRYLVHALLIQEEEYDSIQTALSDLGEWVETTPILFLSEESPETEGLMIYHPSSMDVFTSEEALQAFKEETKEQVKVLREAFNDRKQEEDKKRSLIHDLGSFFERYPHSVVKESERLHEKADKKIQSLEASLKETTSYILNLEDSLKKLTREWQEEKEKAHREKEERINRARDRYDQEHEEELERLNEQKTRRHDQYKRQEERFETSLHTKNEEFKTLYEEEKNRLEQERDHHIHELKKREEEKKKERDNRFEKRLHDIEVLWTSEQQHYNETIARLEPLLEQERNKESAVLAYIPYEEVVSAKREERNETEERIPVLERTIQQQEEKKTNVRQNRENAYQNKATLAHAIRMHEEDFKTFQLEEVKGSEEKRDYTEQKRRVGALESRLNQKQGDRDSYLRVIRSEQSRQEPLIASIEETGLSREWVRENRVPVTEKEMKDSRVMYNVKRKEFEQEQETKTKLQHELQLEEKTYDSTLRHTIKTIGYEEPFLHYDPDFHEQEKETYKNERDYAWDRITALQKRIEEEKKGMDTVEHILAQPVRLNEEWLSGVEEALPDDSHRALSASITKGMRAREENARNAIKEFSAHLKETAGALRTFQKQLQQENFQYHAVVNQISGMISTDYMASYTYIDGEFQRIFETLQAKKEHLELELHELQRNKETLADSCLSRAKVVYSNIMSIPKQSSITSRGRQARMIDIKWREWEHDEVMGRMNDYIERKIHEMDVLQEEKGYTEDEIREQISNHFRTVNLLNVLSPISEVQVKVIKPKKDENTSDRVLTERWGDVSSWSGGEKYSVYMVMFIILINHIRQSYQENSEAWKTILADNPFGKASSGHILKPIFEIAERNDVQFICLTAHKEEGIYKHFPVVYSLRLRHQFGTAFLTETKEKGEELQLQTAFYRKDNGTIPPKEEDVEAMDYETFKKQGQASLFDEE
ncbi:hypothetical protein IMZ31_19330 (plasmid) [Pontibacillus sp. ALD_SL1]|uniref:hypothetical protein n=1 Tax=Pontibacillus sp. ALD_SL1 TaxID=2777185 RepID=UPI001A96414B|nr:hypothetical protein [Pontibacillus sp. ALD_SL1]QST02703.1 hypothetical protein IMZ31_19330 [Pontibacillus sp. ALD_SL1]